MKTLITSLFLLASLAVHANDGAFYARGNHLIPIFETDISVKKEILTIKKIDNKYIEVTVYYEFFNPKEEKTITVGFEAASPMGDVDGRPKNGRHPYMRDFTVQLNDQLLPFKIAYVTDSGYAKNGKLESKGLDETNSGIANENDVDFFYVYHFEAKFKKGLNIIKHTYNYDLSSFIDHLYNFSYTLTAANRWANKRIDDFTLVLDMGEFESFAVNKNFFNSSKEWIINGIGKSRDLKKGEYPAEEDAVRFHIQKGNLLFQKTNFSPKGELFVFAEAYHLMPENYIPFSYYQQDKIPAAQTDEQKRILKNLPYARRGYVFKNPEIQKYYEAFDWYIPNPNYIPETNLLTDREKEWMERWK